MSPRRQATFKMSEGGHRVVGQMIDRVENAGFDSPNTSQVHRAIMHVVMNDKNTRDRVFALLCQEVSSA